MNRIRTRLMGRVLAVAIATAAASVAHAQTINISTGTNGSGIVLSNGATDPNWHVSVAGGSANPAVVSYPADQCCGMETVNASRAKWINNVTSPNGPIGDGWNNDPYTVFSRSFDLTGYDLSTVGINGVWRVADGIVGAFLNGNFLFSSRAYVGPDQNVGNWGSDNVFLVALGSPYFTSGINTLEFQAETINGGYDGLYLDATVVGVVTPEPASVALLATGLIAIAGAAVRRRRV
jgi:PEP-CTERM motif